MILVQPAFQLARFHLGLGYHRDGEERKEMDMSRFTNAGNNKRVMFDS